METKNNVISMEEVKKRNQSNTKVTLKTKVTEREFYIEVTTRYYLGVLVPDDIPVSCDNYNDDNFDEKIDELIPPDVFVEKSKSNHHGRSETSNETTIRTTSYSYDGSSIEDYPLDRLVLTKDGLVLNSEIF